MCGGQRVPRRPFTGCCTEFMRNKCHRNGGMKFQYRERARTEAADVCSAAAALERDHNLAAYAMSSPRFVFISIIPQRALTLFSSRIPRPREQQSALDFIARRLNWYSTPALNYHNEIAFRCFDANLTTLEVFERTK